VSAVAVQARLRCKSRCVSDRVRYDILPLEVAGMCDKQSIEYVSAAAVQTGLHNRVRGRGNGIY